MKLDFGDIAKRLIPWLPKYRRLALFLAESDHWDAAQLREYQFYELKGLLQHAYTRCPYYRRLFDQVGFHPNEFTDLEQIKVLPILTRAEVGRHVRDLRAETATGLGARRISTSGTSTGTPLTFYENYGAAFAELIFMNNLWSRIGYREDDRKVVLRGNVIYTRLNPRPWRRTEGSLYLSMYHLTPTNAPDYVAKMRAYRPKWLHVYPSALVFLIQLLGEQRAREELGSLGIQGVFCGSEKLYEWQRKLIESTVQARVLRWYGMTEKVVLAGECEKCTSLHVYPQYGYLELIPTPAGPARVVGTGFLNRSTPFIRYEVGDLAVAGNSRCDACGRQFQLIETVIGREAEFVVTRSGVVPFSFYVGSIHGDTWADVSEWQMVQEKPGRLRVFIVPSQPARRASIEQRVRRELERRFQDSLAVDIEWVGELPRSSAGKFQYFVQHLDLAAHARTGGAPPVSRSPSRSSSSPFSRSSHYFDTTYPELQKMIQGGVRYLSFARDFQWKSPEQVRAYQLDRLRAIVTHAHQNIPFYRCRFQEVGFEPGDLKTLDDLGRLPLLGKQDVRDHFWELFNPRQRREGILCQTSGTTGQPLRFLLSREQVSMEWAFIISCWIWIGYRPYDRVAAFRHYEPRPGEPICKYERRTNTLFFSVFDMDEQHLPEYVRQFNRFGPSIVRGYPSSIYIFANFARRHRLQVHSPRAIITSSETLLPQYRSLIEEVFDCPVFDWYGTNERIVSACQCEQRASYHLSAALGIAEFLDLEPFPIGQPAGRSLVVTTLVNDVMPLIRYHVGDLAVPDDGACPCGRGLPLIRSVLGRVDDILLTSDDHYVSPVRFYVLFQEFDMVRQFQVVQTAADHVVVRLDCVRRMSREELDRMRAKLVRLVGENVRLEFEFVEEIQPEPSGKVRNVISLSSPFAHEIAARPSPKEA